MSVVAQWIGYAVIIGVAAVCFSSLCLWLWLIIPMRWQLSRDLPSHLDTPTGPLRLTALVGLSSRHSSRWFFGLMLMKPGEAPRARVLSKKAHS